MSNQEQIDVLNTKVTTRLGPSPVHGVGVFALRDMQKGRKLYAEEFPKLYTLPLSQFEKLHPEVSQYLLIKFPTIAAGSKFAYPDTRIQAYMNHSDDPTYDNEEDVLLKDVKSGEEIFENYRNIPGWDVVHTWLLDKKDDSIELLTK